MDFYHAHPCSSMLRDAVLYSLLMLKHWTYGEKMLAFTTFENDCVRGRPKIDRVHIGRVHGRPKMCATHAHAFF